jgi:hypothetical protein
MPRGCRSVSALAMNDTCQYVYAADMSDDYQVHIYDTHKMGGKFGRPMPLCNPGKSDRKKINAILVLPGSTSFITAGAKTHLKTWTIDGAVAKAKACGITSPAQQHFFTNLSQT